MLEASFDTNAWAAQGKLGWLSSPPTRQQQHRAVLVLQSHVPRVGRCRSASSRLLPWYAAAAGGPSRSPRPTADQSWGSPAQHNTSHHIAAQRWSTANVVHKSATSQLSSTQQPTHRATASRYPSTQRVTAYSPGHLLSRMGLDPHTAPATRLALPVQGPLTCSPLASSASAALVLPARCSVRIAASHSSGVLGLR